MTHNDEEISAERLFDLLTSLSKFIEIKIRMYALGGTALTLLHIKKSTLDIDLNIGTKKEYDYLLKIFQEVGFERKGPLRWLSQEGLVFDLFYGAHILGTSLLPDCLELATPIASFGNVELHTLALEDIL